MMPAMRILLVIIISFQYAFGSDIMFPVSEIPENLKENANVVVRKAHTTFTIIAKDEARYKVRHAVTILNEFGKWAAMEYVSYDKLSKVLSFNGSLYNSRGELIRKLKKSDIYDRSYVAGYSLYEDSRIQIADLQYGQYPYTVEFEFEVKYKYLFQIPTFSAISSEKMSVEHAGFSLIYPAELAPRYKAINVHAAPVEKSDKNIKTLAWEFNNIQAVKPEPFGLPLPEIVPRIMVAPNKFEYEGYAGSMDTWDNLGKWINSLNKGRNVLDPQTQSEIKKLTEGLSTTKDKVKVLYQFLQSKTRYVNVTLGIGGFQPFEAAVVNKTGYGDCKALSNYMVAILETAGIKGYYSLVMAGENPMPLQEDFPGSQFNHVIVSVPNGTDTLWLECTSQTNPFGYIGSFTDNRYALMIQDNGAKLVKTRVYKGNVNLQRRSAEVFMDIQGAAKARISTTYSGLQYENGDLHWVLNRNDELKKWINRHTDIPSFDLGEFTSQNNKDLIPSATINAELTIPKLAAVNGKRIFLTPNLMNRSRFIPEANANRQTDIIVKKGWVDSDTVRYHLPEGVYHEFIPEPIHIESAFGIYNASCSIEEGLLVYTRELKIFEGKFPPEKYAELTQFYQSVKKADEMKVVFLNKT